MGILAILFSCVSRKHYKEYLVHLVNKNSTDPVTILDKGAIEALLRREEIEIPVQERRESDENYLERLREARLIIYLIQLCHKRDVFS